LRRGGEFIRRHVHAARARNGVERADFRVDAEWPGPAARQYVERRLHRVDRRMHDVDHGRSPCEQLVQQIGQADVWSVETYELP